MIPLEVSPGQVTAKRNLDGALKNVWGRLFIPSLSDFFFITVTLWLFSMGLGWKQLLLDGDTGWHIRTGDYIINSGAVPQVDPFSWSMPGANWFAWEWLTDIIYSRIFLVLGMKGIVLYSGLLITLYATIVLRHTLWRGANAFVSLGLALIMMGAASVHYHARPHLITLVFLALSLWLIDADRRQASKRIWLLVPLTVLWTNMHGGFLALIAVLGLLTLGTLAEEVLAWRSGARPEWAKPLRYTFLLTACSVVTIINPYGYRLHQHMSEYLSSSWIKEVVQEFQSPSFRSENALQFEAILFLAIALLPLALRRREFVEPLWVVYFAHQALTSARHIPLFVIIATPIVASALTEIWVRFVRDSSPKSVVGILTQISRDVASGFQRTSIWVSVFVVALVLIGKPIQWPTDFAEEKFPTKMVSDHAILLSTAKLLTSDQWGDYLIFRFYPKVRVFIDGRSDFYGPEIGRKYLAMVQGRWDWQQLLDQYKFDAVLAPLDWPLASLLKTNNQWRVVADDRKVVLFERVGTQASSH